MKQPLVECDILVEVASDRLTAQKGDFLIVYFTDPERRRAIAVKTFQPSANGAEQRPARLALPAPKETRGRKSRKQTKQRINRQMTDTAIEWWRALGQPPRRVSVGDHLRQTVFDCKGDFISILNLASKCRATKPNVYFAMRSLMKFGWVARTKEHGHRGFRLTSDGAAYLENFRRRAAAPLPAPQQPVQHNPDTEFPRRPPSP